MAQTRLAPAPVCEMVLVDDGSHSLVVSSLGLCMKAIGHCPARVISKQRFSLAAVSDPAFIALGNGSGTNLSLHKLLSQTLFSQQRKAQSGRSQKVTGNPLLFVSVAVFCSIFYGSGHRW